VLERVKQQTALQYSHFERHREATIVRRKCAVTMGYEIVVPTGNVPNSGKTVTRRYTNIYYFEDGGWRAKNPAVLVSTHCQLAFPIHQH
jgi:hypothetical protein